MISVLQLKNKRLQTKVMNAVTEKTSVLKRIKMLHLSLQIFTPAHNTKKSKETRIKLDISRTGKEKSRIY